MYICLIFHVYCTKYNYDDVLHKSILFYAAQRSGNLPVDNPIPWRADSALKDRGDNGEGLTGGWYNGLYFLFVFLAKCQDILQLFKQFLLKSSFNNKQDNM
jgi:hypothetical protein